jgi:alpha-L-arabinofuranosidase
MNNKWRINRMVKKHTCILFMLGLLLAVSQATNAQPFKSGKKISNEMFGLFFEDINYSADGGIYAEMVQNRSFEYTPAIRNGWSPFSFWHFISPGFSIGNIAVETNLPVHPNNPTYIVLDIEFVGNYEQHKGEAGVGLKNPGFDGMVVREGESYNFSMFAKMLSASPIEFLLTLENPKGEVLAKTTISTSTSDWQKYNATFTAIASNDSASLVILAQTEGKVALDMVSLFPENTFKNRPNGLRADLAKMLADMQPKFVRFPGGCLVHGSGLGNMYRWKNTIGPIEERKGQRNIWGYHQSGGLGFFEYFQFCADIGAKPIPILPAAVSCQNSGGTHVIGGAGQKALCMHDMEEYIQEVLDLVEWANGPVTSTWGSKRAAAGHPEPFNLEYIGIGNEDKITPEFEERFTLINNALKEKYPEIKVIGTSGPFSDGEDFDKGWALSNKLQIDMVDEHYYKGPEWFLGNHYRYDKYNRKGPRVYLGEYASWGNKLFNAIVEAAYMTSFERNGDVFAMASYAPLLAKKSFTQWTTDLIFFDNVSIVPTPNFYVQEMFMTNQGDYYFENVVKTDKKDSLQASSCVVDSKTGDVILRMVNVGSEAKTMKVDLSQFKNLGNLASQTVLTGSPADENTFENPDRVKPVKTEISITKTFEYIAPAMSLTIIRVKSK